MANTYELIKGETIAAATSSYTFSAIPSTYKDLILKLSLRSDQAAYTEVFNLRFNGITTTTYSYTALAGVSATASSFAASGETYARGGVTPGSVNTANTFGNAEVYIPSYTAAQNKQLGAFSVSENNTVNDAPIQSNAALWRSTAAITSISILPIGGPNWIIGSSFYLYGIKNS
jgi:hypothetical protein